jgi:hypothetical protein
MSKSLLNQFHIDRGITPPTINDPKALAIKAATLAHHGQRNSREFDSCFEMGNGKQVVLIILRTPSLKADYPPKDIEIWEQMYPDQQLSLGI